VGPGHELHAARRAYAGAAIRKSCAWKALRAAAQTRGTPDAERRGGDQPMKDVVFVAVTLVFFAVCWLYAESFERL
jgi:hypothetical protein